MTAAELVQQNLHRFKTTPRIHQISGVETLLKVPNILLADDLGLGKTKQVIDTACLLWEAGEIHLVLVVTPASLRRNWADRNIGEIPIHCWLPHVTFEFHSKGLQRVYETTAQKPRLAWVVTNYEFIRNEKHCRELIKIMMGKKVWLVGDESSYFSSYRSSHTKAMMSLKPYSVRRCAMNGTPVGNTVETLFSQMNFLDPRILGIQYVTHFRHEYCVLEDVYKKGVDGKAKVVTLPGSNAKLQKVTGVKNGEKLQKKLAPYVLRRLKSDCLDLPPIVDVTVPVYLSTNTWKKYTEMRDEALTMLDQDERISMATYTITKIIRMAQLCSGILGGVTDAMGGEAETVVISSEKHDYVYEFLRDRYKADPNFRLVLWTRFRKEQEILLEKLKSVAPIFRIYGGQSDAERDKARVEMKMGKGPVILLGQPQAGGLGLNFTSAHTSMYVSQDYSLLTRLQSRDRTHRIGQEVKVTNYDLVASGPRGERTIDMAIVAALQRKENIATWTTSAWRAALAA